MVHGRWFWMLVPCGSSVAMLTSRASTRRRTACPTGRPLSRSHRLPPSKATRLRCHRASRSATRPVQQGADVVADQHRAVDGRQHLPPPGPAAFTRPWSSTTRWSASRASSSAEWVTYSIGVLSSSRRRSSHGRISCLRAWSSAASGSSSSSRRGCVASARAMATRWRSPPESCCGQAVAAASRCPAGAMAASQHLRRRRATRVRFRP